MPSGNRIPQLRFGGWYSYQEWADHGFMPKHTHRRAPEHEPAEPEAPKAPPASTRPKATPPPEPPPPQPVDLYPAPPQVPRPDEPLIRPYILTHGRTCPRHDLEVHTLITTTERGRTTTRGLPTEHAAICRLCRSPQSVAEIAALLKVPLGVARVLVDDMETQDLVAVTARGQEDGQSVELLTRVLEGLCRL
jgi:Protein of unknown function (DUF742)